MAGELAVILHADGRCQRPHGHWHTTTMISSIRLAGSYTAITTEGATDTDDAGAYVRHILVASLPRRKLLLRREPDRFHPSCLI